VLQNHQTPPVTEQHLIDGGCSLWNGTDVYNAQGKYVGKFEDVEWGYGASGMLCINHIPITDRPVPARNTGEGSLWAMTQPWPPIHQ
jgi:hypothetical protein